MKMPVLKKSASGQAELVEIDLDEVVYIKIENRNIVYHTLQETYYHISTLSDLEEHLLHLGFALLDKTNIVNMNKIKLLDKERGNVYFETEPNKDSKFAAIALAKQKMLKARIDLAIADNTEHKPRQD